MRYERKKEENSEVFYEVLENSTKAAEFSYQQKFDETGQVCEKFWIRRIHLEQKCLDYRYLDAILQFIQYKCWCSGCRSMYVRLSARNLMDIERYKRYGFYVIAQEEQTAGPGEVSCAYVLKYPLPREWEEMMNKKERAFYYEGKR